MLEQVIPRAMSPKCICGPVWTQPFLGKHMNTEPRQRICQIDQILEKQSASHFKNWKLWKFYEETKKGHTNTGEKGQKLPWRRRKEKKKTENRTKWKGRKRKSTIQLYKRSRNLQLSQHDTFLHCLARGYAFSFHWHRYITFVHFFPSTSIISLSWSITERIVYGRIVS